jgi:hypothetical protein
LPSAWITRADLPMKWKQLSRSPSYSTRSVPKKQMFSKQPRAVLWLLQMKCLAARICDRFWNVNFGCSARYRLAGGLRGRWCAIKSALAGEPSATESTLTLIGEKRNILLPQVSNLPPHLLDIVG